MGFFSKLFSGKDSKKESDQDQPAQEGEVGPSPEVAAAAAEPAPPSDRPAPQRTRTSTARVRQPGQPKVIVDGFPAPGRSSGTDPGLTAPPDEPRRPAPRQARTRTTTEPAFPAPGIDGQPIQARPPVAVQAEPAARMAEPVPRMPEPRMTEPAPRTPESRMAEPAPRMPESRTIEPAPRLPEPAPAPEARTADPAKAMPDATTSPVAAASHGPRSRTVRVDPASASKPAPRPAFERNVRAAERSSTDASLAGASPSRDVPSPAFAPPSVETRPSLRQRAFDLQRTEPPPLVAGTIGGAVAPTPARRPNGTPAPVRDADTAPVSVRTFDFKSTLGRSDAKPMPVESKAPPLVAPRFEPTPAPIEAPVEIKPEPPVNGAPSFVDTKPTAPIVTAPALPERAKPVEDPFSASGLDWDLDSEFDKAFEGAQAASDAPAGEGMLASDERTEAELQGLFAQMAAFHLGQVRDFIIELSTDEASKQWVEICRGAVSSMAKAAERLKFSGVAESLAGFSAVLDEAHARPDTRIRGEIRTRILQRFEALREALPEAFAVAEERDRREPVIIHALLCQIEGVQVLERDRLYAAGVNRLSVFYEASAGDLASTTGMSMDVARRIKERFDQYRRERAASTPDEGRSGERKRLRMLIATLGERDIEFAAAERADDGPARRRLRKERANLMHEIEVVLAQIGEVELVARLARVPVDRKIQTIESYLRKPAAMAMG